jgi:two-component system, chemotaxis family, response regulator Rcp1
MKADPVLKRIPIIVLTVSDAESDITKSYQLNASCYLSKPGELDAFESLMKGVSDFWLTSARLPPPAPVV